MLTYTRAGPVEVRVPKPPAQRFVRCWFCETAEETGGQRFLVKFENNTFEASLPGPERAHGLATVGLLEEAPVDGLDAPHDGRIRLPKGPGLGLRLRERAP